MTKHPILSRIVRGFATIFPPEDLFRENTDCILNNLLGKELLNNENNAINGIIKSCLNLIVFRSLLK